MRLLRVADDFVPISEFKAQASEWLRRLSERSGPVVVTHNGKPAGVLLSPREYDALMERARFLESVEEGLRDAEAGRTHTHSEVKARLAQRRTRQAP